MNWRGSNDLQPLLRPIADLQEDPQNARLHPDDSMETIRSSLTSFGQQKAIVVWRNPDPEIGLMVLCGNGTFRAASEIGWDSIACTEFEGTEVQARAYAIVDNRSSELSTWHPERLAHREGPVRGYHRCTGSFELFERQLRQARLPFGTEAPPQSPLPRQQSARIHYPTA